MALRNRVINDYKTKIYILSAVVTIILMILEILTHVIHGSNVIIVTLNKIFNAAGFSLSPVVPYILILFSKSNSYFHSRLLLIPLLFNALMCILSIRTGWIFSVDNHNQYMRGSYFLIPTITSMFYYIVVIMSIRNHDLKYDKDDAKYLTFVFIMPIVATVIQILFNDILVIWGCVSLSLMLYYIFLRELQFKYDTISEIKNRAAFEKELEQYVKNGINAAIIVFDLNNFKKINDFYGHKAGDNAIYVASGILKESFAGIGEPYRIGGDEFCVICKNATKQIVENALLKLEQLTYKRNLNQNIKIIFAYGFDFYIKNESKSMHETITGADKAMYKHKAKLKGLYGRRYDD